MTCQRFHDMQSVPYLVRFFGVELEQRALQLKECYTVLYLSVVRYGG